MHTQCAGGIYPTRHIAQRNRTLPYLSSDGYVRCVRDGEFERVESIGVHVRSECGGGYRRACVGGGERKQLLTLGADLCSARLERHAAHNDREYTQRETPKRNSHSDRARRCHIGNASMESLFESIDETCCNVRERNLAFGQVKPSSSTRKRR